MKYLTNYIKQNYLEKIFICFPDPNFKKSHNKRRLINNGFLSEYAYVLKNSGRIYFITDIEEYFFYALNKFEKHSLFKKIDKNILEKDEFYPLIFDSTEEGQKVSKNKGGKFSFVYECVK